MKKNQVVILVHGFINNSKDMLSLKKFFGQYYHDIISVDLPTTFVSMNVAVAKLCKIIKDIPKTKSITFIAHSMGGIIVCKSLYELKLENIDKCVFIATPFMGSKVANFGDKIPFYSKILKPNKELKVTSKYLDICNSIAAKFSVGLIAGKKHSKFNILAKICLNKDHDGLVEVKSVFAINSDDRVVLNKNHSGIHHDVETLGKVLCFLEKGKFENC